MIDARFRGHPRVSAVELAALQRDGRYTDELCVRIVVNAPDVTHATLNVPETIDDVVIELRFSTIELQ